MNEQISLKFDILTNLSKSSLRDLEYEVAHARSYYLNQIKSLQTSIDESKVQALKDACTAINLNQNCNDISNSHEVMPEEIKVQSLFNTEDIQTELKVSG